MASIDVTHSPTVPDLTMPTTPPGNASDVGTVAWGVLGGGVNIKCSVTLQPGSFPNYHVGEKSYHLVLKGFNFLTPQNTIRVTGIHVEFPRRASNAGQVTLNIVQLTKDGITPYGTRVQDFANKWPKMPDENKFSKGGDGDLWGKNSTWTPAEIAAPTFGVIIQVQNSSSVDANDEVTASIKLDKVNVTVWYQ